MGRNINDDRCGNCRFHDDMACHRHSPSAVLSVYGKDKLWPPVTDWDWCGDHEREPARGAN
jgi:hypothetical protein